jgi:hypothetical protein
VVKHTKVKIVDNKITFIKEKVKGPGILCLLGFHRMRTDPTEQTKRIFNIGNKKSMEITFVCTRPNCYETKAEFFEIVE